MAKMTRQIQLCCLALALASGVSGYTRPQPSTNSFNLAKLKKTLQKPTLSPGQQNIVHLEPVLRKNPLETNNKPDVVVSNPNTPSLASPIPVEKSPAPSSSTAASITREDQRLAFFVSASAALAGFSDVLCLARFGCFVNMMTGNILKATTALANGRAADAVMHSSFVLSYMLGVAIFAQVKARSSSSSKETTDPLSLVAPIVAILFGSADLLAQQFGGGLGSLKALQVSFLAMGFGVVNTAASQASGGSIFFALTGHLTKISNALHDFASTGKWKPDALTQRSVTVVRSFLSGAFLSALLLRQKALVLPLCTGLGLLYASLFAWYAPMSGLLPNQLTRKMMHVGRSLGYVGRRFQHVFDRLQGSKKVPARVVDWVPSPIIVETFPVEDIFLGTNRTQSGVLGTP